MQQITSVCRWSLGTSEEFEIGKRALQMFVREFPSAKFVAVGKNAQRSLNSIGIPGAYVRHPAYGGATKFAQGLVQSMENQDIESCSFDLSGRNVHVWAVRTEAPGAVAERFELVLGPEEKGRAARFRSDHLRYSFVIARGVLRILLGHYLNASPNSIRFKYGARGKPALAVPANIEFNVSHSAALAVFAFTAGCEVGVDIEQIRALQDMQTIADRFFCSEEATELMSLTADQRERGFYLCWTRKEAYVKATGDGLSTPLDCFRVTLQPSQPARFIHLAHDTRAAESWTLHDLRLASNYAAALAYRDTKRPVALFRIVSPAELLSVPIRSPD
jgi:4'-phosphopantetheinyl transferase